MSRSVDVSAAAVFLGVSVQRVRRLLAQRRLVGWKQEGGIAWDVLWPLVIRSGTRGPRLGRKPKRRNTCASPSHQGGK